MVGLNWSRQGTITPDCGHPTLCRSERTPKPGMYVCSYSSSWGLRFAFGVSLTRLLPKSPDRCFSQPPWGWVCPPNGVAHQQVISQTGFARFRIVSRFRNAGVVVVSAAEPSSRMAAKRESPSSQDSFNRPKPAPRRIRWVEPSPPELQRLLRSGRRAQFAGGTCVTPTPASNSLPPHPGRRNAPSCANRARLKMRRDITASGYVLTAAHVRDAGPAKAAVLTLATGDARQPSRRTRGNEPATFECGF